MAKVGKKISNGLITLSSAAILAVYAVGYERTSPAADRLAMQTAQRHAQASSVASSVSAASMPPVISPAPSAAPVSARRNAGSGRAITDSTAPSAASVGVPTTQPQSSTPATSASEPVAQIETASTPAVPEPPPVPDRPAWRDGTYLGWGYSRHGDIQAFVQIQDGRIIAAGIEKCWTRYSCSWIDHLPAQVVSRQNPDVDYVSGATQSVDAFYGAVVEALNKAK